MGVTANSRSIVHSGDGTVNTAAPPDVCKTPSPGGPIPVPYVNIANDSDLAKGAKKVKIEGNPVGLESSNLSTSSGDEAGTAGGGLLSSKFKGKLTWGTSSSDVKAEGKGVARFGDVAQHNGNSFNTAFTEMGGTGFAYGDDFSGLCPVCEKSPTEHALLEKIEESVAIANAILTDLNALEDALKKVDEQIERETKILNEVRKNPTAKPATILARETSVKALEEARKGCEGHRREKSNGYMFGVMVCLNGKRFAAVSGREMPPKFETIAQSHGCTPIKEAATLTDLQNANPRCAAGDPAAIAAVKKGWDETKDKHDLKTPGYNNAPGSCAGAKLIAKSGHVGASMTEIFFAFRVPNRRKTLTFSAIYRGPEDLAPGGGVFRTPTKEQVRAAKGEKLEARTEMTRPANETMPSCQTCQDTLFMARCDLEKQSCG